ncbi:MAG: hypothetical protein LUQ33_06145 [Methanoregulaceae archaeon]|nr:hypothetical protein [Methanoregulaceae archaeon]
MMIWQICPLLSKPGASSLPWIKIPIDAITGIKSLRQKQPGGSIRS